MSWQVGIALAVGLAATVDDLRRRHIANWIPAVALIGGLIQQGVTGGLRGVLWSLGGAVAGFCVFLIFYLLGGMGGGDIKLMAGFGAILGPQQLLFAAFLTMICGGLMAAGFIAANAVSNRWRRWRDPSAVAVKIQYIPYAPAIALGVWLSLVPR